MRQRDDRSQPPPGTHYTDGLNAGQGAALTPSDPDWAFMCNHIAAVLYGIGAASTRPELLFRLHQLDENELITKARAGLPLARKRAAPGDVLRSDDLAELFGLDLAQSRLPTAKLSPSTAGKSKRAKKKKM